MTAQPPEGARPGGEPAADPAGVRADGDAREHRAVPNFGRPTRRVAGVAVLVLAVVAVVVAARLDGTRIAGTAIAPPGLSAPNVGDCVSAFADPARPHHQIGHQRRPSHRTPQRRPSLRSASSRRPA